MVSASASTPSPDAEGSSPASGARPPKRPSPRLTVFYQTCDLLSEALIYFALVFSPWAFGTTQPWAIQVMNGAGYAMGILLLAKLVMRWRYQSVADRWNPPKSTSSRVAIAILAVLTIALLAFSLIAAVNARSIYRSAQTGFEYRHYISWLPHSYDQPRSWAEFAKYLALAGVFWAVRDWLFGKTQSETRASQARGPVDAASYLLPGRLRRLLWVLSLNGALLGTEAIAQRLSGTNRLLWIQPTRINSGADYQFGPYAYRSNAAQYFNLVWPLTLGFWWIVRRENQRRQSKPETRSNSPDADSSQSRRGIPSESGSISPAAAPTRRRRTSAGERPRASLLDYLCSRDGAPTVLLVAVALMVICPLMTLSRGGVLVAFGNVVLAMGIILFGMRRQNGLAKLGVIGFFMLATLVGLWVGWDKLSERMRSAGEGLRNREAMYHTARQIARDFPVYGTGPGTFKPVFESYRTSPEDEWLRQLHNDWLETRITFGWVGSSLIALSFLLATGHWFTGGGIQTSWRFAAFLWLALAGCLIHARFDFPLQIYSVLLLFLILCAILSTLGRRAKS